MKNTYFRNFITTAMVIVISFLFLGTSFVLMGRSYVVNSKRQALADNAGEVAKAASALNRESWLGGWKLRIVISTVSGTTGNHVFICDREGRIISCSDSEVICPHLGRYIGDEYVQALRTGGELNVLTDLNGLYEEKHFISAKEIVEDGNVVGYVFVSSEEDFVGQAWGRFLSFIYITVAGITVIALCMAYAATRQQSKPLKEMASAAHKFAHGDFSVRVSDEGREDELGELTRAFNTMADELEKSEEQRQEFVANISHELKTPMTTIAGFADGILDGTIPYEKQDRYLETISSETKRLSRLVRKMLDISKINAEDQSAKKKESFDLTELFVRNLITFEEKINAKNLSVDAIFPEESIFVLGNADDITQVIYNLLENAVKFSPEEGILGVRVWKQEGKAYVSVKNMGETIPQEELDMVFQRFHKTDRSRSQDRDGVGLGLYIVKSILNNYDEEIAVTSRDGVTEFVFTMTLRPEK